MEKSRAFVIVVVSLGVLALVFQAIGFFAPAWISFDMSINSNDTKMNIEIDMGIWATTACVDSPELGGEKCQALTNDKLKQMMGQGNSGETAKAAGFNFMDDFTKLQVLATLGGVYGVAGLILFAMFCFNATGFKIIGILSALSWGVGGIFVFAAVGLQAQQNSNFNHGVDILDSVPEVSDMIRMKVNFPWAILMSGIGAFLNIVVAGFITFKACYMNDPNGPTGWNRFSNQAV